MLIIVASFSLSFIFCKLFLFLLLINSLTLFVLLTILLKPNKILSFSVLICSGLLYILFVLKISFFLLLSYLKISSIKLLLLKSSISPILLLTLILVLISSIILLFSSKTGTPSGTLFVSFNLLFLENLFLIFFSFDFLLIFS